MEPVNLKTQQYNAIPPVNNGRGFASLNVNATIEKKKKLPWRALAVMALFISTLFAVDNLFIASPSEFKKDTIVEVNRGDSTSLIADKLESSHVVRSAFALRVIMKLHGHASIEEGPYVFAGPLTVSEVASRISASEHGITRISISIPEGWTRAKISERFAARLQNFSTSTFMSSTLGKEGYLFPDTYRFFVSATSGEVVSAMEKNFQKKTADLQKEAESKGRNWNDVLTLASILEGEGGPAEDERAMIADILLRRIDKHMRLQVDAPFAFLLSKGSLELNQDDLYTDSPYNTYRHEGLPPGPIGSPGVASIKAALNPIANDYLFYLHDKTGVIHYAKTNADHVRNKMLYLK